MVKHIVDTRQLTDRDFLHGIFSLADEMRDIRYGPGYVDWHKGKIVASLFYEPSTRTKMALDAAALRLGAKVVGTENAEIFSSYAKGELTEHSLWATQQAYDLVIMRHKEEGTPQRIASTLDVPLINAGDGKNQHPIQALKDVYTIHNEFKRLDGLKIVFVGDIAHGRTVRSLAYQLAHRENNAMSFVSTPELGLPTDMRDYLQRKGVRIHETSKLDEVIPDADILYVTRLQQERTANEEENARLTEEYKRFQITVERANRMKDSARIMHPLPINTTKSNGFPEIVPELDTSQKSLYFLQSNNGLFIGMAAIDIMLKQHAHHLYSLIGDVPRVP